MSDSLYGASFLWMSLQQGLGRLHATSSSTVPLGTVSRLIGCRPYQAHDSTPLESVSSTQPS